MLAPVFAQEAFDYQKYLAEESLKINNPEYDRSTWGGLAGDIHEIVSALDNSAQKNGISLWKLQYGFIIPLYYQKNYQSVWLSDMLYGNVNDYRKTKMVIKFYFIF